MNQQQKIEQIERAIAGLNAVPITGVDRMMNLISAVQLLTEYRALLLEGVGANANHQNQ